MTEDMIKDSIYSIFDKIMQQTRDLTLVKQGDTPISGGESALDSLALVNFLITLEAEVRRITKSEVKIADEQLLLAPGQPLKNVDSLAAYIADRLS